MSPVMLYFKDIHETKSFHRHSHYPFRSKNTIFNEIMYLKTNYKILATINTKDTAPLLIQLHSLIEGIKHDNQ